jgi:phosphatidylglycerophosphate synthase
MENIKELREICQKEMAGFDTWQDKLVCRRFSIYFTWLFLHTRINAMQATWIFLFLGFIPGLFFAYGRFLVGAILLQCWYIFDGVDGEIARYRKQTSFTGAYFDSIIHYIIHPYIFICIGFGVYSRFQKMEFLLLGVSSAISIMLISILYDMKNSTLFDYGRIKEFAVRQQEEKTENSFSFKSVFSSLHKLCTYPSIMNIITIVALGQAFSKKYIFGYLILFYGLLAPLIFSLKLYSNIRKKFID